MLRGTRERCLKSKLRFFLFSLFFFFFRLRQFRINPLINKIYTVIDRFFPQFSFFSFYHSWRSAITIEERRRRPGTEPGLSRSVEYIEGVWIEYGRHTLNRIFDRLIRKSERQDGIWHLEIE